MTRKRKILLGVVAGLGLPIVCLALYLALSDLSGWRDTVARIASNAIAREITIAGEFEVDFGIVTRVRATGLSLANTDWGSEPSMARIDRLDAEINLWELLSGSIHLPNVDIEGGRAIFESDAEAGSNWRLGKDDGTGDDTGDAGPVRLRIDRIQGRGVELVFGGSGGGNPVELIVETLDSTGDPDGMHQLTGGGSLRGADFTLSGSFGSFADLINLEPFDHDLRGTLGSTELRSSGTIGRIAELGDLEIEAEATIPNPTEIYRFLGLSYTFSRPLTIKADATTTSGMTDFTLTASGEAAELQSHGTIDSLLSPGDLDLDLKFKGPDIRPLAALAGITNLDENPFDVEGRFTWRGYPIVVSGLEIRVGENWLAADGRLGKPPLMLETDFRFEGAGPDVAEVASLAGLRMPHDMYEIDCHLLRVEKGLQIEDVRAKIGSTRLTTTGFIGDPPEYANTDLVFEVRGPNLAHYRSLLGTAPPSVPFAVGGRLAQGDQSIALHDIKAKIGSGTIEVDGHLTTVPGMTGTDLTFATDGLDLLHIGDFVGVEGLPASPLHASGRLTITQGGYRLRNVTGGISGTELTANGLITNRRRLAGTTLEIAAEGNDAAIFDGMVAPLPLPRESFRVKGQLRLESDAVHLTGVDFELGGSSGRIDALIDDHIELTLNAGGPSLKILDSVVPGIDLPPAAFTANGSVSIAGHAVTLDEAVIEIADNRVKIDGTLMLEHHFEESVIKASLTGGSFGDLGRLIGPSMALRLPEFPDEAYSASVGVSIDETGYHAPSFEFALGSAQVAASGTIGHWPDFNGSDIEISIDGPDASLINSVIDFDAPVAPFKLNGRISKDEVGLDFHRFDARLANYRVSLDGQLGRLPKLIGTSLTIDAEGPDLEPLRSLTDIDSLPSRAWRIAGRFEGNPQQFKTDGLVVRLGSSDVSGDLRIDLQKRPRATARLRSSRVDVSDMLPVRKETTDDTNEPPDDAGDGLQISNEPWDLSLLDRADIDLDWTIGEARYFRNVDRQVELSLVLDHGRLEVDRFRGVGDIDGEIDGRASVIPVGDGHRFDTEFHVTGGMINLAGEGADPSQYTSTDLHINMSGTGRSLHQVMSTANGRAVLTVDSGVMEKGLIDLISADILVTVLEALNPFAKQDSQTNLNCAVIAATFSDGVMTMDPAAVQTDKVTVLGDGTIDFGTEDIRFDWITKPRKGVGLSASMFTNPYIRLGGTLTDPAIEMKPAEALATTSVAVATMGISLVAKGLLDRITAEKKVCEKAMKKVAEMEAEGK